jgi:hypothetical protein
MVLIQPGSKDGANDAGVGEWAVARAWTILIKSSHGPLKGGLSCRGCSSHMQLVMVGQRYEAHESRVLPISSVQAMMEDSTEKTWLGWVGVKWIFTGACSEPLKPSLPTKCPEPHTHTHTHTQLYFPLPAVEARTSALL